MGGGNSKKSKSISGIFGWELTFLDLKCLLILEVFLLDNTIIFMNLSHGTMGLSRH